jgi:hypothetical protein
LFDGVEFNDEISCTDVLYDLAFLLMDLWRRRLPRHANAVLNRYLPKPESGTRCRCCRCFCPAVPRFAPRPARRRRHKCRTTEARRGELHATAREYLAMAERLLHPPPPCLVAVGGLSGSGKSTLARMLAPGIGAAPGAVHLRSDEIRKELAASR